MNENLTAKVSKTALKYVKRHFGRYLQNIQRELLNLDY